MTSRHITTLAGIIGPLLFFTIVIIEPIFRPEYSALSMYVSELALGPRGWVQSVNFSISGALIFLFALGLLLPKTDQATDRGNVGAQLIALFALACLGSGPFIMDPLGTNFLEGSFHGKLHAIFGLTMLIAIPASCFFYLIHLKNYPHHRGFALWTQWVGLTTTLLGILLLGATNVPLIMSALENWVGLIQRLTMTLYVAWLCSLAWKHRKELERA